MPLWSHVFKRFNHSVAVSNNWRLHWVSISKQLSLLRSEKKPWDAILLGKSAISNKSDPPPKVVYEELIYSINDFLYSKESEVLQNVDESRQVHMQCLASELALNLSTEMIQQDHTIKPELLSILFRLVAQTSNPTYSYILQGIWYANASKLGSLEKRPFLSQIVLGVLATGSLEQTVAAIREMATANAGNVPLLYETYEKLLIVCCQYDELDYAQQVMSILHARGSVYSRTWGLFIQAAARTDSYQCIKWAWTQAISPASVMIDDHTYMRIAQIAAKNGNVNLATTAYVKMIQRREKLGKPRPSNEFATSVEFFSSLMDAYAIAKNIPGALNLLAELSDEVVSNVKLRNIPRLVGAVSRLGQVKLLSMVDHLKGIANNPDRPMSHSTLLYSVLCAALIQKQDIDTAMDLFRKIPAALSIVPNEDTMICFLQHAHKSNDLFLTKEILSTCASNNIPITRRMCQICLDTAQNVNNQPFISALTKILHTETLDSSQSLE